MNKPGEDGNAAAVTLMEAGEALGKIGEAEQAAPEPKPEAEPAPEAEEGKPADDAGEPENDKGRVTLTPEQQEIFDKRLGKEVAKRKAAEEKAAKLEADLASANTSVDQATVEVAKRMAVPPEYLKAGEAEILKKDDQLTAFENWADENADGYEDGKVTYTAAQIQKRLREVQREHLRLGLKAEAIRERARAEMLEDLAEGRKARSAKLKAAEVLKKDKAQPAAAPVEAKPAASAAGGKATPEAVFEKKGKTREAAAEALGMM